MNKVILLESTETKLIGLDNVPTAEVSLPSVLISVDIVIFRANKNVEVGLSFYCNEECKEMGNKVKTTLSPNFFIEVETLTVDAVVDKLIAMYIEEGYTATVSNL